MEIFRKKNESTVIAFPMVTTASPETFNTGETVSDTGYYSDAGGAWTTLAITDTVSEVGSTGMYELSLTAAEMNHDNIIIKFTSTNAADTAVVIRTRGVDEDDLATSAALTTAQNDLDTITGSDGVTLATTQANNDPANAGDAMALSAGAITNASLAGNMEIVFETDFATNYNQTDNAWVTNGTSFVGTGWNTGKTGYSISGSITTLDGLNDITAGDVWAVDATTQQTQGTFGQAIGDPVADTTTIYQAVATDATGDNVSVDVVAIQTDLDNGTDGLGAIKTDTAAILDDTGTTGVLVSDGTGSGQIALTAGAVDTVTAVTNQVTADITAISGDSTAADRLEGLMDGIIIAQVNDASATTTAFAADGFTEATDDHFNGRLITFISGALVGQQTDITDYDAAGGVQGSQEITVTALTEAPANNDFFVIH